MIKIYKINETFEDQRLDKYLKRQFSNLTQSFIEKNLRKKNILVNDKTTKSNVIVKKNDLIKIKNFNENTYQRFVIKKTEKKVNKILKKNFENSILYENENVLESIE